MPDEPSSSIFQRLDEAAAYPYSLREYTRRFAWEWVQRTCIRLSPRRSYGWRRFWLRAFGADLAPNCTLRPRTKVIHPWLLKVGEYTLVADDVTVYNLGPITIGSHTVISQDAYLCAGTHDMTRRDFPLLREPITIGSGVWIAAGAFIGPGVTIGDNSVVGARAVVVKDVPPGVIVAGNPARVIRPRPMGPENVV